ncbi:MAG: hypothetical protein LKF43_00365 [Streptococcaceae bacterium]|jgi:hypothetical protein|nr:hypothetical protein [Streptococcaceae bacterium]
MSDLIFEELPKTPTIKNSVIDVKDSENKVLGQIRYWPSMKHYKFHPASFSVFSTANLIDIIEKLEKENIKNREQYIENRHKAGI